MRTGRCAASRSTGSRSAPSWVRVRETWASTSGSPASPSIAPVGAHSSSAPDFTVAAVDLDTLAVAYHAPSARTLAKSITGPSRQAAWLGNDTLAVSGFDYKGSHDGEPVGLRLVDTRDWSVRMVDAGVGRFGVGEGSLVAGEKVFGFDGTLRYRVDLGTEQWLSVQGQYGYVCGTAQGRLRRVLQLGTGATLRRVTSATAPNCPTLLYGQSSS